MTSTVLVALAIAVGAPALKDKAAPATLVGEWDIEQCVAGGNPKASVTNRWVFRADGTRAILSNQGKEVAAGNYTIDSKAGTLELDATGTQTRPYPCRYKLDGDTLTLNVG